MGSIAVHLLLAKTLDNFISIVVIRINVVIYHHALSYSKSIHDCSNTSPILFYAGPNTRRFHETIITGSDYRFASSVYHPSPSPALCLFPLPR